MHFVLYSRILLIFLAWLMPALACAQTTKLNSDEPVEIVADELEVLQKKQQAIFRRNVVATQGNVRLRADLMTVFYRSAEERDEKKGSIDRIEVDSNVVLATPQESAQGAKGIFYVDRDEIVLLNNVVLTRGENILKGQRLDYNLKTGKSLLTGGSVSGEKAGDGKRVRGVFLPRKQSD